MEDDFCCMACGKPLSNKIKLSARYCNRACRNKVVALRRRSETLRLRNEPERILQVHRIWLTNFQLDLLRNAPSEAGGYQVGLWTGQMMYWFPSLAPKQTYRYTLNRTRTQRAFFLLRPFEPPSVPLIAHYQVRYVQNIPPHPILPQLTEAWWIKIPYELPHRTLPFNLNAVPREQR